MNFFNLTSPKKLNNGSKTSTISKKKLCLMTSLVFLMINFLNLILKVCKLE